MDPGPPHKKRKSAPIAPRSLTRVEVRDLPGPSTAHGTAAAVVAPQPSSRPTAPASSSSSSSSKRPRAASAAEASEAPEESLREVAKEFFWTTSSAAEMSPS